MFLKFAAASVYLLAMAEADIIIPDAIEADQSEPVIETKSDDMLVIEDDDNTDKNSISCCYFNDP